jgi:DNA replication and repair protein RecF
VFLTNIKIRNFRNIKKLDIKFESPINYFFSPNGTGKTNLLEAIQCLSIGRSLRAKTESELVDIHNLEENQTVYLQGMFVDKEIEIDFSHTYTLDTTKGNTIEPASKKKTLLVNKTKTPINSFLGRVPSIWFSPESIKIITSSPRSKRKYFDDILIQLYPDYIYNLRNYEKSLRHRNKLLQQRQYSPHMMRIWTEQLITYGSKIIKARQKFFQLLNANFETTNTIERYNFKIEYHPNIVLDPIFDEDVDYVFRERLRSVFDKDKTTQSTTRGPHKDDWHMLISINSEHDHNFIRADKFASRGQQRMSLIVLQIVLIHLFQKSLDRKPLLLLDDIFSELDPENEKILVNFISSENIQTFITGVSSMHFEDVQEFNIEQLL